MAGPCWLTVGASLTFLWTAALRRAGRDRCVHAESLVSASAPGLGHSADLVQPKPRYRGGCTDRLPDWAVEFFVTHYHRHTYGYRKTAALFTQLHGHLGLHACASTVAKYVRRTQAREQAARARCRHHIPGPEPANREWCIDMTGKVDAQGCQHTMLGAMDRGTRACLHLARMAGENTAAVLVTLKELIARYGKPDRIRTDNASVFTCLAFATALAEWGICHVRNRVASPWQNRIERMFGTFKGKLKYVELRDGLHLDELLGTWVTWYNHARPHQHLYGWTPAQAWQGIDPFTSKPTTITPFHEWNGLLTGYLIERGRC